MGCAKAHASDRRALIEQALDEPARIVLENIRLADAVRQITEQTGITLMISPEVMAMAPYGADTRITKVDIANMSVREGLSRLFGSLGMKYRVTEQNVEIVPSPGLRCLNRPAAWAELGMLGELSGTSIGLDGLDAFRSRVQFQVATPGAWELLAEAVAEVGAGAGDDVLSIACRKLGWSWCVDGRYIVIRPIEDEIAHRLQRRFTFRMRYRSLMAVLQALGEEIGISVKVEPDALAALPFEMRNSFSLAVRGQTAEQALDEIVAATGLGYFLTADGVIFYDPSAAQPSRAAAPGGPRGGGMGWGANPYVGRIVIPLPGGGTFEWLLRASDMPDDLMERRHRDIDRYIEDLRAMPEPASIKPARDVP